MKFFGDVDVGDNYISNVVITEDASFKVAPKVGSLAFRGKRLYICAEIVNGLPIWASLTNEITTKVINFETPSTTWILDHGLNSSAIAIQVYDANRKQIIPGDVEIINANQAKVTFGAATAGFAVCVFGSVEGVGKSANTYETSVVTPTVETTVNHNLGYQPTVAVYVDDVLVLPESVTHNSLFSTTIVFTDPFTGVIRFT